MTLLRTLQPHRFEFGRTELGKPAAPKDQIVVDAAGSGSESGVTWVVTILLSLQIITWGSIDEYRGYARKIDFIFVANRHGNTLEKANDYAAMILRGPSGNRHLLTSPDVARTSRLQNPRTRATQTTPLGH